MTERIVAGLIIIQRKVFSIDPSLLSDDFKREGALAKMTLGRSKFNDKVMIERLTIL